MSKPVTGLTVFGASTSGTTTQLDNNFLALQNALNDLNTYPNYLVDTGAADAYVVALAASLTGSLSAGLQIQMRAVNTNTGASTLNYNGNGAIAIVNQDGSALSAGQIVSGGIYQLQYSNVLLKWILQSPYGNGWRLITRQTANANATVNFNASLNSAFDQYRLTITDLRSETDGAAIILRVGNGNASTPAYQASAYEWSGMLTSANANAQASFIGSTSNGPTTSIPLTGPVATLGNATAECLSSEVQINGPAIGNFTVIAHQTGYVFTDGTTRRTAVSGHWGSNSPVTSLQVLANTGNISSGNFALYGLVKI